ncbi:hypothetical protein LSCM1_01318 [Leishmania martiniquensis]|uniref:Protein SirB1 N-terminal domain-containing protein n=1 Tax=Leishmania martiniquensis TaxID=1580590 RepID=A0A836KHT6_9TRYP|nr:hypothetical protein LSCM1_01318 [Leishmania martiniquensis]
MKKRGDGISKELSHSLYRRVLKVVSVAGQSPLRRMALLQWIEFAPPQVCIAPGDEPRQVARRSFEAPYTPAAVANAFTFLKEARDSLFVIRVLAEWERLEGQGHWDLCDGTALMSAALHSARVGCDSQQALERRIKDYQVGIRSCVQRIAYTVQERLEVRSLKAGHAKHLNTFIELVREAGALERREVKPEDFSLVSLLQNRCASECILNIIVLCVLRSIGIHSTLVGADLSFRWVRVTPPRNAPAVFASWTYGAMRRREVEQLIRTADRQWHRPVLRDTLQRKSVLCALLRRQLESIPRPLDAGATTMESACKAQILFLLS